MEYTELHGHYRRLRTELDAAYALPEWDISRIDKITDEIREVELALASAPDGADVVAN